jgi:RecB family exonuclease
MLPADPWLNRAMRREVGLLLPERNIGLSAHDFQQAVAAKEVVLTRSIRDADSQTVPSRWLNRLLNLLSGLPDQNGPAAVESMRERGAQYLSYSHQLGTYIDTVPPEKRPAPRPPTKYRPRSLSVTQVEKLIRDPYHIYGQKVLQLRRINSIAATPNAAMRGTVIHKILERFAGAPFSDDVEAERVRLLNIANEVLGEYVPWPATRQFWEMGMETVAHWFLQTEAQRQRDGQIELIEASGSMKLPGVGFELSGTVDRIDRLGSGELVVYDYKTGKPPTSKEMRRFKKQLLLEAVMAEHGAFSGLDPMSVDRVANIGMGSSPSIVPVSLQEPGFETSTTLSELVLLITAYADQAQGYTSRRAMQKERYDGDFDHLARFGEWGESDPAVGEDVG